MDDWALNGIVESCRDSSGHVDFADAEAMAHAVGDPTYDDIARLVAFVQDANSRPVSQDHTASAGSYTGKASKEDDRKLLCFFVLTFVGLILVVAACILEDEIPLGSLILLLGAVATYIAIFKLLFQ